MAPAVPRKGRSNAKPNEVERPDQPSSPSDHQPVAPDRPGVPDNQPNAGAMVAAMPDAMPAGVRAMLQRLRAEVEKNCDHVGTRFADEARAIHNGDTPPRAIYGEATPEQAEALADEGISIAGIPWIPRSDS